MYKYTPDPKEVTLVPVIPVDRLIHNDYCFCDDMTCECHENEESVANLHAAVQSGELSSTDADLIYRAKTV